MNADIAVDVTSIERQLAELWRAEKQEGERAVTKAALWNVVAHTWTSSDHALATETLARASAAVPQRTIVIQADPSGSDSIASWISANCHLLGKGRQVCSEEVSIVAAGERVRHIPPLVRALLIPDMPVAVWWLGELPRDHHAYAELLLDPADRLIIDSAQFDSADDLGLVRRIAEETSSAPADLNWARLDEWRTVTASVFDPPDVRQRLQSIRCVRVTSGGGHSFGETSEALLYVSWLAAQSGSHFGHELLSEGTERGINAIEIEFEDGLTSVLRSDAARASVVASSEGGLDCVTRSLERDFEHLIVRLLKRPEADRVYMKTLATLQRIVEA